MKRMLMVLMMVMFVGLLIGGLSLKVFAGDEEGAKLKVGLENLKADLENLKTKVLEKFDADSNGKLEGNELTALTKAWRRLWFMKCLLKKYDKDGDGYLSKKECVPARTDLKKLEEALLKEIPGRKM